MSPAVFIQHVKKTEKNLGKYVALHPHPKSMTGMMKPSKETLKCYGFMNVNVVLANTVEALQNATTMRRTNTDTVAREDITETVVREVDINMRKLKGELTNELKTMRQGIVEEAREYTDKITEELKSTMSTLEITLCSSMKAI